MDDPSIRIDTIPFKRIFKTDLEPTFREIAWIAGRAGRRADIDMGKFSSLSHSSSSQSSHKTKFHLPPATVWRKQSRSAVNSSRSYAKAAKHVQ